MPVFNSGKTKSDEYYCKIYTIDAELQFTIEATAKGSTIFSLVCQTIGLREHWYFGLKYLDKLTNEWNWLEFDRTIISQSSMTLRRQTSDDLIRSRSIIELYFVVKFYPEDITHELIQDITRRLFYLQTKQDILNMNIYCPPDTAAHLASLSLQAKYGDYDQAVSSSESFNLENEPLLPLSCFQKIELSRSDWFDRIIALWRTQASLTHEEAILCYLKHAQDLDMFGLTFFEISKMQGANKSSSSQQQSDQTSIAAELWLGIDSLGIRFYKKNKLRPEVFFSWSDIKSVTAHDKKVLLNLVGDKHATFAFYTSKASITKEIFDLSTGNHHLYLKRRQEQSIEIQQMRYFEEQQQKEKMKIVTRERHLRLQAEKQRDEIEQKLNQYQQQIKDIHLTLVNYEEVAELLAHRAHISSEDARLQTQKVLQVEIQLERCKYEMNRNVEEKRLYTRQIHECEQVISKLVNDSVKNRKEADELKLEVAKRRIAEATAREKLLSITHSNPATLSPPPYRPITKVNLTEKESKQTQLASQLQDLKNVIQLKKIEERQTPLDKAYEENLATGDNKYSTIQKARSNTTSKRMAMLQDL